MTLLLLLTSTEPAEVVAVSVGPSLRVASVRTPSLGNTPNIDQPDLLAALTRMPNSRSALTLSPEPEDAHILAPAIKDIEEL